MRENRGVRALENETRHSKKKHEHWQADEVRMRASERTSERKQRASENSTYSPRLESTSMRKEWKRALQHKKRPKIF
jgi:hypothetical protein